MRLQCFIQGTAIGILSLAIASYSAAQVRQTPNTLEIIRALKPKPRQPAVRGLGAQNRGITVEGGDVTSPPPSIDLQVNFEFNSSNLTNDAQLTLRALGEALQSKDLSSLQFRVIGHTDGRGTAEYNMELSKRRADAVRAYLTQFQKIAIDRLETEGKGKTELIDAAHPEAGINRRVQILTIGPVASR